MDVSGAFLYFSDFGGVFYASSVLTKDAQISQKFRKFEKSYLRETKAHLWKKKRKWKMRAVKGDAYWLECVRCAREFSTHLPFFVLTTCRFCNIPRFLRIFGRAHLSGLTPTINTNINPYKGFEHLRTIVLFFSGFDNLKYLVMQ